MVRIQSRHRAAACEDPLDADLRDASCGPSPPEAAARRCLTASILLAASPQPSGRACDMEEQPSARGRLRAAGRCATDFTSRHFHPNKRLRAAIRPQIVRIQSRHRAAACEDRQRRQGAAGLRRRRLRPADLFEVDPLPMHTPVRTPATESSAAACWQSSP